MAFRSLWWCRGRRSPSPRRRSPPRRRSRSGGRRSRSRSPARRGGARWVSDLFCCPTLLQCLSQAQVKVSSSQKTPLKLLIGLWLLSIERQQHFLSFMVITLYLHANVQFDNNWTEQIVPMKNCRLESTSFFVRSPKRVLYFVLLAANFTWKGTNLQNLIEHLKSSWKDESHYCQECKATSSEYFFALISIKIWW